MTPGPDTTAKEMWGSPPGDDPESEGEPEPDSPEAELDATSDPEKTDTSAEGGAEDLDGGMSDRESSESPSEVIPDDVANEFEDEFSISQSELASIDEFIDLTSRQQRLVLDNLKQVTLGRIQQEAKEEYRQNTADANILSSMWQGITKQYQIAKQEKKQAEEIKNGGLSTHREVLQQLINGVNEAGLDAWSDAEDADIHFTKEVGFESDEAKEKIVNLDMAANELAEIPYEWQLETADSNQVEKYEQASQKYQQIRTEVLDILSDELGGVEAAEAINKVDERVHYQRFLNTNPEVEEALKRTENQSALKNSYKDLLTERGIITVGGGLTRAATASMMGALAVPLASAGLGYYRGKQRAEETLAEQEQMRRRGTEKDVEAAKNFADADMLVEKIDDLISRIDNSDEEDRPDLLASLDARATYTQRKLDEGLVNFGAEDEQAANKLDILQRITRARTYVESMGEENEELNEAIEEKLDGYLNVRKDKISAKQEEHIKRKAWQGAAYGAGFSLAGYFVVDFFTEKPSNLTERMRRVAEDAKEQLDGLWSGGGEEATNAASGSPHQGETVFDTPAQESASGSQDMQFYGPLNLEAMGLDPDGLTATQQEIIENTFDQVWWEQPEQLSSDQREFINRIFSDNPPEGWEYLLEGDMQAADSLLSEAQKEVIDSAFADDWWADPSERTETQQEFIDEFFAGSEQVELLGEQAVAQNQGISQAVESLQQEAGISADQVDEAWKNSTIHTTDGREIPVSHAHYVQEGVEVELVDTLEGPRIQLDVPDGAEVGSAKDLAEVYQQNGLDMPEWLQEDLAEEKSNPEVFGEFSLGGINLADANLDQPVSEAEPAGLEMNTDTEDLLQGTSGDVDAPDASGEGVSAQTNAGVAGTDNKAGVMQDSPDVTDLNDGYDGERAAEEASSGTKPAETVEAGSKEAKLFQAAQEKQIEGEVFTDAERSDVYTYATETANSYPEASDQAAASAREALREGLGGAVEASYEEQASTEQLPDGRWQVSVLVESDAADIPEDQLSQVPEMADVAGPDEPAAEQAPEPPTDKIPDSQTKTQPATQSDPNADSGDAETSAESSVDEPGAETDVSAEGSLTDRVQQTDFRNIDISHTELDTIRHEWFGEGGGQIPSSYGQQLSVQTSLAVEVGSQDFSPAFKHLESLEDTFVEAGGFLEGVDQLQANQEAEKLKELGRLLEYDVGEQINWGQDVDDDKIKVLQAYVDDSYQEVTGEHLPEELNEVDTGDQSVDVQAADSAESGSGQTTESLRQTIEAHGVKNTVHEEINDMIRNADTMDTDTIRSIPVSDIQELQEYLYSHSEENLLTTIDSLRREQPELLATFDQVVGEMDIDNEVRNQLDAYISGQ